MRAREKRIIYERIQVNYVRMSEKKKTKIHTKKKKRKKNRIPNFISACLCEEDSEVIYTCIFINLLL